MTRHVAALLLAAAVPGLLAAQARAPARVLEPDTVFEPPGGPRVVLLPATAEGVAALRLFVALRESPAEAGAGRILRDLARERMEVLGRPVGARVSASRTPWGVAYQAEGASADFDYLAYLLRQAVQEPDVEGPGLPDARARLEQEAARVLETPASRVRAELRAALARGAPPPEGTPGSVKGLGPARVRGVWRRSHQASAMTLVVSAPVGPEVIVAATQGMGAPEEHAAGPLDAPALTSPAPDPVAALQEWYGEAFGGGALGDPHGPVAALLVAWRLQAATAGFETGVELWEFPDRWALAVTGNAYPARAAAMRRTVSAALSATRDGLDRASVARAVARVRRDLALRARTPGGLVAAVGRAMEGSGDAGSAARRLEALASVDVESTARFLTSLLAAGPARASVRP